jgi:hypothetical protein
MRITKITSKRRVITVITALASTEHTEDGCPYCGSTEYLSRARCRTVPTTCTCGKHYYSCPVHQTYVKGLLPHVLIGTRETCICDLTKFDIPAMEREQALWLKQLQEK